jgi:hypothetical protein
MLYAIPLFAIFFLIAGFTGLTIAMRTAIPLCVIGGVLWYLTRTGQKIDAIVSCAGLLTFHVVSLNVRYNSVWEPMVVHAIRGASFLAWLLFAMTAIRSRKMPNRAIGFLLILFVFSPITLDAINFWTMVCCNTMGVHFWTIPHHVHHLNELLWGERNYFVH